MGTACLRSAAGGDDVEAQRRSLGGEPAANVAQPDDAQRLPFDPQQRRPGRQVVCAALGLLMVEGRLAGQRQEQGQRMLGHLDEAVVGHVGHGDAAPGGAGHVDVVQADAQPGDDPQLRPGFDHFAGDLGPVGHDGIGVDRGRGQRGGVLGRRHHELGADGRQRLGLDVQVGPGVIGEQDFHGSWKQTPPDQNSNQNSELKRSKSS